MRRYITFLAVVTLVAAAFSSCQREAAITPAPAGSVKMGGELAERVQRNFDRLEDEMYRPDSVFHSRLWLEWPGDAQGRIVLGLVCDTMASGREPLYLKEILDHYPAFMNEEGYFGPLYDGVLNEQQLSGNGWVLRGLCQYYEWTGDKSALDKIRNIVDNLFMKGKGIFKDYPIDPAGRKKNLGDAIGEIVYNDANWVLSSDIGCVFIGMEGLIHAYKLIGGDELKELIDELIARYLEVDLTGIRAQTHASLTAMRGLIRYAGITGDDSYIQEAVKRYQLYRDYGMTCGYQNYNWFCRPETWSEPCAVVDSYMVAVQLWMCTGDESYLDDAELIYYNGLCHNQRDNGGFGCDFIPSSQTGRTALGVRTDEASWCCSMRGAEGLQSAVSYSFFTAGDKLYVPFYHNCSIKLENGLEMTEETDYPFDGKIRFKVAKAGSVHELLLRIPVGTAEASLNGHEFAQTSGFLSVGGFKDGDVITLEVNQPQRSISDSEGTRYLRGPLLLGKENGSDELTPIYHLMDPKVSRAAQYNKEVLF